MGDPVYVPSGDDDSSQGSGQWYTLLNKYHWFVLIVAALGWLFDTMDQQLFNFARVPAMKELLAKEGVPATQADVDFYGGLATAIFLIGWASGGLVFGVLGDRIGRAKTMLLTILMYSLCTGLSSFSIGFWDFAFYRLITGLGVGGEFAVGVALVAEVMPTRARQHALSLLQALSAVGNITAATITMWLGHLETTGVVGAWEIAGFRITTWRLMFLIGTIPALLAIVIRGRLKEPETWHRAVEAQKQSGDTKFAGSYSELFLDPRWRHGAIIGLALATSGVIGVWGIAFFSFDLVGSVLRKAKEAEARAVSVSKNELPLLALIALHPQWLDSQAETQVDGKTVKGKPIRDLVDSKTMLTTEAGESDVRVLWNAMLAARASRDDSVNASTPLSDAEITEALPDEEKESASTYLALLRSAQTPTSPTESKAHELAGAISSRNAEINGYVTFNKGLAGILLNLGAFFGMYGFGALSARIGRRPTFLISFIIAAAGAMLVFYFFKSVDDLWMFPIMGFCVLSPFAGYAIYFPELFPTRLRSTGTSFCYNVGRYLAATGPLTLGYLTGVVFKDAPEPLRNAGIAMCAVYLIGILALPFAKETKDQPLPE